MILGMALVEDDLQVILETGQGHTSHHALPQVLATPRGGIGIGEKDINGWSAGKFPMPPIKARNQLPCRRTALNRFRELSHHLSLYYI
jgi:hypothetical protein